MIFPKKEDVFVMPTDTVYGICASALMQESVARVYTIKGRTEKKPCIILIKDWEEVEQFGVKLSRAQKLFVQLPSKRPVTFVFSCSSKKFDYLHRGTGTLAFRVPQHKVVLEVLAKTGPLIAPSANKQGKKPVKNTGEAKKIFGDAIDKYVFFRTRAKKPSVIISLVKPIPEIIRM